MPTIIGSVTSRNTAVALSDWLWRSL